MPDNSDCPPAEVLALFAEGKLPDPRAWIVAAHLDSCFPCRQAVDGQPPDTSQAKVAAKPGGSSVPPNWPSAPAPESGQPPQGVAPAGVPPELAGHPKFRILRELGKGGMGVIYLAEHRVLEKQVALKVITPALVDNPDALARFHAEAKAAARLDHPNIARAYDADQAGDLHFLVMEYVEGQNLAQIVEKRGPLPVVNACSYAGQAAQGLQHACEQGMVHRDIKPHNLMLRREGKVKVLDFGLARLRSENTATPRLTKTEAFLGTPDYMAPEQARDARQADVRADIYALGCTLYHLLAGRPPFVGDTPVKLVLAHFEQEARPLHELRPDVPAELSAVVAKMLAKDPAQRYQQPSEVAQALRPFIKTGPRAAGGVPATSWAVPPPCRQRQRVPGAEVVEERMPVDDTPAEAPAAAVFEGLENEAAPLEEPEAAVRVRYGRRAMLTGVGAVMLALGLVALPLAWAFFNRPVSPPTPPSTSTTRPVTPNSPPAAAPNPPITKPVTPKAGLLILRVNEPGSRVFLNGEPADIIWDDRGMTGEVSVVPGRGYRVKVKKDGFKNFDAPVPVQVESGGTKVIAVTLERLRLPQPPNKDGPKPPGEGRN